MNKLILSIILVLVAVGITVSFTRAEYSEYQAIKAEAKSYEDALSQADELAKLRQNLLVELNDIDITERNRLEKFLPRSIDTVRLTIEVTSIARNAGMEVEQFSFTESQVEQSPETPLEVAAEPSVANAENPGISLDSQIQSQANYSQVDMNLSTSGTYEDFKNFLEEVQDNLRLTDIRSLSVTQGEEGTNSYQLVLRTYWLGT